jgi:hypothetical protein
MRVICYFSEDVCQFVILCVIRGETDKQKKLPVGSLFRGNTFLYFLIKRNVVAFSLSVICIR